MCSFIMSNLSESLRSLMSKERPWANRSGRSWQMSDHERFAQVPHSKWVNCSFFLSKSHICSFAHKKLAIAQNLTKIIFLVHFLYVLFFKTSNSLIPSFLMSDVRESLRLLTKNKRCEQIAKVAHQKVSDHDSMSDSLRSLTRPWANCSGRSPKMRELANRSLIWVSQKTSDLLWKPMRNSQPWADATVLSWIATVYIAVNWIAKVYSLVLSHGLEQFTVPWTGLQQFTVRLAGLL